MVKLKWFYYLFYSSQLSTISYATKHKKNKTLFNSLVSFRIPTPLNTNYSYSSKVYFWYLFYFLKAKPCVRSFRKFLQNYKKDENQKISFFYRHVSSNFKRFKFYKFYLLINTIKALRFTTPRRVFKFRTSSRVFSFYDVPYPDLFSRIRFINSFNPYLVYLKINMESRPAQFFFETFATTNIYANCDYWKKKQL